MITTGECRSTASSAEGPSSERIRGIAVVFDLDLVVA